jgi:FMN phosphatase YigB (HAD superfamily)
MSKPRVILWDLDGTLFDGGHRVHLMPEDKTVDENWDAFNLACNNDPTVPHMASVFFGMRDQLLSGAAPFTDFYFLTARSKVCEEETIEALHKAGYGLFPLIMRERGDHRTPVEFKSAMIDEMEAEGVEVYMAFDDDVEVVQMMRERGIYTIHVCEWWKFGQKVND